MKKGIVVVVGILWVVSGWVSPGLAQGGAGTSSAAPVYRNGVAVPGGPASLQPLAVVVDSFLSSAPSYSMGLAFDGTHLWNDEAFSHWFGETDIHGNLLRTFTPSEGNRDMAFDGRYIWATDWSTLNVTKYDTTNGSVVASFPAPFSGHPDGMAWDGHYLWVGEENGRIYHVDTTMQVLRSIPAPNSSGFNPRGLAFDGNDLWVGNQTPGIIYRVDTTSGGGPGAVCLARQGSAAGPGMGREVPLVHGRLQLGLQDRYPAGRGPGEGLGPWVSDEHPSRPGPLCILCQGPRA